MSSATTSFSCHITVTNHLIVHQHDKYYLCPPMPAPVHALKCVDYSPSLSFKNQADHDTFKCLFPNLQYLFKYSPSSCPFFFLSFRKAFHPHFQDTISSTHPLLPIAIPRSIKQTILYLWCFTLQTSQPSLVYKYILYSLSILNLKIPIK